jgi:RNA polymerase sigma-70 factor (ECF subfamily)
VRKMFETTRHSAITLAAFEASALPHLDDLFRTARRALGDPAQAEDMVQEAYYQAWKSFHRFQPGTNCRGWLFKILFHVIHHHRRKWLKFAWVTDPAESPAEAFVYKPPVLQHLTDEEVLGALAQLPQPYREVVLLADVEGFSHREIAEVLRIPAGTVMSRLNRGRKLLRRDLAGVAESYGIRPIKPTGQAKEAVQTA